MIYNRNQKKAIRDFIKSIDKNYKVGFEDLYFQADTDTNTIYIGTLEYDQYAKYYNEWFNSEFPACENPNWWLMSLLHEIGHLETVDLELATLHEQCMETLDFLDSVEACSIEDINYIYFQMPCEWEATYWGASYYIDHKEKCDNFLKTLAIF